MRNHNDLNSLYNTAESYHNELFAEQRSNILLTAGLHYTRRNYRFLNTLRKNDNITKRQKLRLVKNHLQKITKTYINNILSFAPGTQVLPKNESEIQDQKCAELNGSVLADIKHRHKFKTLVRHWAQDYIEIGEAIVKVFFDKNIGQFQGYEPVLNDKGEILVGDDGVPVAKPVFTGDFKYERIHGFNLLTDPDARSWNETRWVCYRKMVDIKDLKSQFKEDDTKTKYITESSKKTWKIFDGATGSYLDGKGLVMVREFYFKPSAEYPKGYYYITTEGGILHKGELPLGKFPILYVGFDEVSTSSRSFSIIKQLRPFQAEVNRCASKIAEHQTTLGDDKVIISAGTSLSPGGTAHGVKSIKVSGGQDPKILPGRAGDQFVGYMTSQISEMYQVSNIREDTQEKDASQVDAYAMLFRGLKDKKKFIIYGEKFGDFLVDVDVLTLELAKAYLPDNLLIPAIDKKEHINIPEFKASGDLGHKIVVKAQSEDIESQMGKQLSLNHILQYAGGQLDSSDIGKLIRHMPYMNQEELFGDLTIDFDNARNDILALDRGTWRPPRRFDNHTYLIKKLTHRMKSADFEQLDPKIQQMYDEKLQIHEQALAQQEQQKLAASKGFIPSGGFLVTCDFYVPKANDPTKTQRVKLPSEAINWLTQQLEVQGSSQALLDTLEPAVANDIRGLPPAQQAGGVPQQ